MRRAVFLGFLAACFLAMPANAAVIEEFTVEDWSGLALSDDETGRLSSCAVYSKYQNGATLFFIKHMDSNWTLSVVHDSWTLTEDSNYPVRYKVDGRGFVDVTAIALDTDQIGLGFPDDHDFLGQIRRGKLLTVAFQGKEYGFELSNSSKALQGATQCIERHRDAAPQQVATEPPAPEDKSVEEAAEVQVAQEDGSDDATGPSDTPADETEASTFGEQQSFGPWVVTATDDGSGNFVNCTAFGVYGDDQLILSYRSDDAWEFGLYRAAWALDTNQTYYLWYNVDAPADGNGVIKRPVEAAEPTRIFFEVSAEEDLIERMENGRELNVQLRGISMEPESYTYALDQAKEAFAATRECTRRNIEIAQQAETEAEPATDAGAEGPPKVLPAIGVAKTEDFEVPGWTGAAFADAAGAFSHCAIEAEYQNGTTLALLRTAGGPLLMTLRRTDWTLQPGAWVPLRYTFKGEKPTSISTEAQAIDASTMGVNLGTEPMILSQMRAVGELVVETQEKSLSFDISDVGPGLDAIDSCAERLRAAPAADTAPAPQQDSASPSKKKGVTDTTSTEPDPPAPPAPPADSPEEKAEAAGFTTALLVRSGYPGHVILTGKDVPESLKDRDAAWKIGETIGMTDVVQGLTTAEIKEQVTKSDTADCGGPLKSEEIASSATPDIVYFSSFCDGPESDFYVYYVVIPRAAGGHYNVTMIDLGDGTTAKPIGQKLFDTAKEG